MCASRGCITNDHFRLAEIEYDFKSYPARLLNSILDEKLTATYYTWYSPHNQASEKIMLPAVIQKAIQDVSTITLRGRKESWVELEHRIMKLFSSRKKAVRGLAIAIKHYGIA